MTLTEQYQQAIVESGFSDDPAQRELLVWLEELRNTLEATPGSQPQGLFGALRRSFSKRPPQRVKGLYIYGGVGRGKTWLMDLFFKSLSFKEKRRVHFHRFMQSIHHDLRALKSQQNPLTQVAQGIIKDTRVLCFDEFYVSDIADAMLLAGLFEQLFAEGVVLVATSNTAPDDLYKGGLQRVRFMPAIELIKQHTRVIPFAQGDDYRLRTLEKNNIYHTPANHQADAALMRSFSDLSGGQMASATDYELNGRALPARGVSDNVVWFDFDTLCRGPRSTDDYIELAQCHNTIIVSGIPQFTHLDEDAARRFINMIDEYYDRGVNLLASAAARAEALYQGSKLAGAFERTSSRLIEMQSHEYLARAKTMDVTDSET